MYRQAAAYLKSRISSRPKLGLILGTGLGQIADGIENPVKIPYGEVPGFPVSTVADHAGRFLIGRLAGREVLVMQGRVHFYEGYTMSQLALPVQTMAALGVGTLLITNAAGGIRETYKPGDLVLITDHIKLDLDSPLRGENPEKLGNRFFDMTRAYTPSLQVLAREIAAELGIPLQEGVYAYMGGPQFETPAEIRMLRLLGADLVGMSTVPEVICAAHAGMRVLALSCVTNMAAGMPDGGLNEAIITEAERQVQDKLKKFIEKAAGRL